MLSREICKRCGSESGVGFNVPDDVWHQINQGRWNTLCLCCFVQVADALRIQWDKKIEFYPVSLVTFLEKKIKCQKTPY